MCGYIVIRCVDSVLYIEVFVERSKDNGEEDWTGIQNSVNQHDLDYQNTGMSMQIQSLGNRTLCDIIR